MVYNDLLGREDLEDLVGRVVYVEDISIQRSPPRYYPSVVFNRRRDKEDKVVKEITAVQPAAARQYVSYWPLSDYGRTWLAHSQPAPEMNEMCPWCGDNEPYTQDEMVVSMPAPDGIQREIHPRFCPLCGRPLATKEQQDCYYGVTDNG